jgi:hypothetical protein
VIQYLGIAFNSPLGLLFVMQYLGMKISIKRMIAILTIPSITLIMVATNDLHHLQYRVYEIN